MSRSPHSRWLVVAGLALASAGAAAHIFPLFGDARFGLAVFGGVPEAVPAYSIPGLALIAAGLSLIAACAYRGRRIRPGRTK
ncbi:MAG: hypothetical protein KDG50_01995 [Chromatiales bacterium]|nr:hypothetical protein [Chromatiales bacterium]